MAYEIEEAKKLVIEAGLKLQQEGLIVRTWGNISARISDTEFVVTPSGKAYSDLTTEDIVVVNIKKCTYEGDVKPSSECGIHADVYANRADVNFVIHTHQVYASVISILGKDIALSDEEKQFLGDRIPCALYGMSSSPKLRKQVKKALKKSVGCSSMLLRNHGALCMGTDFDNAFEISSVMEQVCKYQYEKLILGFDTIKTAAEEAAAAEAAGVTAAEAEGEATAETMTVAVGEAATETAAEAVSGTTAETAAEAVSGTTAETAAEAVSETPANENTADNEAALDSWFEADESDLKDGGYVDYGTSRIDGNEITLTLGEKEYKYNLGDKKPITKNIFKRSANKIALIHSKIYEDRGVSFIYHVTLPNIVDISKKTTKGFVPYLDDQAQIVGDFTKLVGKIGKKPHFESGNAIARGLKNSGAILIAGQGALCTGNSMDDLEATAYILEKGCMAAKLALCQADAETVPGRIAKKERAFYVESYSKLK